jgi:hypothetical protein
MILDVSFESKSVEVQQFIKILLTHFAIATNYQPNCLYVIEEVWTKPYLTENIEEELHIFEIFTDRC